jgi:uncharacterized protein (DUF58 family)
VAFAAAPLAVVPPARPGVATRRCELALAALEPQLVSSNPLAAMLRVAALVRHRALVLLLTDLEDAAATSQLAEAARLLSRRHLVLIVDLWSPEIGALAARPAKAWLDPFVALAAEEHRATVRRNCAVLRSLGCRTLLAPPASAAADLARVYTELKLSRRL